MEVIVTLENGVCELRLNRPEVFNSFNESMAKSLQKSLDEAELNPDVRAIIITGEGKAFCAGQDLGEAIDPEGPDLETIVRDHYNPIILRIRSIEKPIIASVNGVAAGAGANIALACDITFAAASASFIQAFSKIGLIPDSGGTYFLPRLVGTQKALALMMTADKLSAKDAEDMNLIYKAVDDNELSTSVKIFAEQLAKMPTRALGLTKKAVNSSWSSTLEQQLEMEKELQVEAGQTYDFREGVNAFLEKRKPNFKGE